MSEDNLNQDVAQHFNPPDQLRTAVLFLVFNRPDTTRQVFSSIRQAKPPRLYVAADGPREDKAGEKERCDEVRKISTAVDWPCEVKTLFRKKNLRGFRAIPQAIDWFFEHEEAGIILEDDNLPSQSFYCFCQELLEYYRDDERFMSISGTNFLGNFKATEDSYYFSRYAGIWGWATWKRAWKYNLNDMQSWHLYKNNNNLKSWSDGSKLFELYWSSIFNDLYTGKIDHWDYRWILSCWVQNGITASPVVNLVKNIGFGPDATHTKDPGSSLALVQEHELAFPLKHPAMICRNVKADILMDRMRFNIALLPMTKTLIKHYIPFSVYLKSLLTRP